MQNILVYLADCLGGDQAAIRGAVDRVLRIVGGWEGDGSLEDEAFANPGCFTSLGIGGWGLGAHTLVREAASGGWHDEGVERPGLSTLQGGPGHASGEEVGEEGHCGTEQARSHRGQHRDEGEVAGDDRKGNSPGAGYAGERG